MKLTQVFPHHVKPVRKGVYRTWWRGTAGYSRWTGNRWMIQRRTVNEAARVKLTGQFKKWQGLAKESK